MIGFEKPGDQTLENVTLTGLKGFVFGGDIDTQFFSLPERKKASMPHRQADSLPLLVATDGNS